MHLLQMSEIKLRFLLFICMILYVVLHFAAYTASCIVSFFETREIERWEVNKAMADFVQCYEHYLADEKHASTNTQNRICLGPSTVCVISDIGQVSVLSGGHTGYSLFLFDLAHGAWKIPRDHFPLHRIFEELFCISGDAW